LPEDALQRGLARLQAAEFLYETRLFPERDYTFKHALTHEVAYGSLLLERRRVLHARIVESLEALGRDQEAEGASGAKGLPAGRQDPDQIERLAHHALRGAVWAKALAYCRQAGEKAMAQSAHREAVGYFEQAISALPHLPETRDTCEQAIDLRLALRTALAPSGDFRRVLAVLHEAETLAETLDDPRRLGQIFRFLSAHFRIMGVYDQAVATAQRTLALATAGGHAILHALANLHLGLAYHAQGDYRQAINCLEQTMASLDRAQHREGFGAIYLPSVNSRSWLARCHAELGMFAAGRAFGEEGLQIAEVATHPASLMVASYGVGLLALRQGDLYNALLRLEQAIGLCQDGDHANYFPWVAAALGEAYTLGERIADAVPLLTQALEQTMALDLVGHQALCCLPLGEAQRLTGRPEEAQALGERALALAREHQERGHQAYALRLLGEIAAQREPPASDQAGDYYRQALALAEQLGMRPLQAHCRRGLGTLYLKNGQQEQAHAELSTAIALYRAMDMTFWLPETEAALAQVKGQ
jgi:tetratricopeptide (TPR) repeat protein